MREEEFDEEVSRYEYTTIYEKINTLPWADLSLCKDSVADIIAFKGRSFKVGWGKHFTFATTVLKGIENDQVLADYGPDFNYNNTFSSAVHMVRVVPHEFYIDDTYKNNLNDQLYCQLQNSEFTMEDGLPYFKPKQGFDLLEANKNFVQSLSLMTNDKTIKFKSDIWNLCHALFGDIKNEDMFDYDTTSLRKKQLSIWLRNTLRESVDEHANKMKNDNIDDTIFKVLIYLSGNRLQDAAKHAMESKNPRLSMFVSQIPCPANIKSLLIQQLTAWQSYKQCYLSQNILKLYMLLAGIPAMKCHEQYINVCETMEWIRSFAVYFWYICPPSDSISKVLSTYEEAFTKYLCAAKPTPHYENAAENVNDLAYHLLKYYCNEHYPLELVLNPINHTSDELDYTLSWFLMQTFLSLGLNSLTEEIQEQVCMNFATRLESVDMWHWAIFVLLFIKDDDKKKYYVNSVLTRHVRILCISSKSYRQKEEMLVKHFHLPSEWIDSAKADKAMLHEKFDEAVHYLKYSKRYNEMHQLLFTHVTPDHIICCKFILFLLVHAQSYFGCV